MIAGSIQGVRQGNLTIERFNRSGFFYPREGKQERRRVAIGVKAFRFRLQPILDMRIRQLEAVQQRFALQQQRVLEITDKLQTARQQVRDALNPPNPQEASNPLLSQQRFHYVQHLKRQAQHLQQVLHSESRVLERIREEMREAHIRKKSLERLSEKQQETYYKQILHQEAMEIEDLVLMRR